MYISKKKRKKELDKEAKRLAAGYGFLLCSFVILFVSLMSFNVYIFDNKTNYSVFVLPVLFFILDTLVKEVGYEDGVKALLISGGVLLYMVIFTDFLFGVDFSFLRIFGIILAYMISQFINLSIYYYMLCNYETPYFFVVLNFIFSSLVYNMLSMLLVERLVFSETFWSAYMIVVVIEILISMILGLILGLVRQGVDVY